MVTWGDAESGGDCSAVKDELRDPALVGMGFSLPGFA